MKTIKVIVGSLIIALVGMSFSYYGGKVWIAPKSASIVKNPLKGKASATAEGKKLFTQMCAICHGKKGKGDGMAGMSLNPRPTNFAKEGVQSQTDGAIFWKITEGRAPMASYKAALTTNQRWQLVNYIRTLKKVKK
ncbi:MAG: cytochrome c class I [Flavobacteriales bacterium]|nr:MAG: cytochrome c class I [Flavobacteriales bacterium]